MNRPNPLAKSTDLEPIAAPPREYQELWFNISRRPWRSIVFVPVDAGVSVAHVASAVADVAKWLREAPVSLLTMSDPLDYVAAEQLVGPVYPHDPATSGRAAPNERVIIAVQAVTVEPLGLAVTRTSDAVVLCIVKRHSCLSSVRRTIDLIGRERIAGCIFIH
jgi:hypothetical protein